MSNVRFLHQDKCAVSVGAVDRGILQYKILSALPSGNNTKAHALMDHMFNPVSRSIEEAARLRDLPLDTVNSIKKRGKSSSSHVRYAEPTSIPPTNDNLPETDDLELEWVYGYR